MPRMPLAANSWDDVRRIVSGLLSRVKTESDGRLVRMRVEAERLDKQAQRGLEEQTATERSPHSIPPVPRISRRGPVS